MRLPGHVPAVLGASITLILLGTALLFTAATAARWAGRDNIHPGLASWHTTGSVVFASHWHAEGPLPLRFAMVWTPPTIEQPTLASRPVYTSFMSGSILPLYIVSWVSGQPPSVRMARALTLLVQALVSFVIALIVLQLGRRLHAPPAGVVPLALAAAAWVCWAPSPYYEYIQGYFADQVVLLPFVLFLGVEALRTADASPAQRRCWEALQAVLIVWGLATEWLFAFVAATAFIVRCADGSFGTPSPRAFFRAFVFGAPVLATLACFALQLYLLGAFAATGDRFRARAGVDTGSQDSSSVFESLSHLLTPTVGDRFWTFQLPNGFGPLALPIVLATLALALGLAVFVVASRLRGRHIHEGLATATRVLILALVPCLLYGQIFQEHVSNMFHFFTALKFVVPVALGCALLPLLAAHAVARMKYLPAGLMQVGALAALIYLGTLGDARAHLFVLAGPSPVPAAAYGPFVRTNTHYADIVVSTEFNAGSTDPIAQMYTGRLVHQVASLGEVRKIAAPVAGDYTIALIARAGSEAIHRAGLDRITAQSPVVESHGWILWRMDKAAFEALEP